MPLSIARKLSCEFAIIVSVTPPTTANGSSVKVDVAGGETAGETKLVKISDSDKAKARAERFGTSSADLDEKKAARAARFGIQNTSQKIGKMCK